MNEDLIKEKFNNHQKTLDEHEKRLDSLEKTYSILEKMDYQINNLDKSVQKINEKLDKQQNDKGNKWDKLIDYIFYFVIAAILGYVAMKIGIK